MSLEAILLKIKYNTIQENKQKIESLIGKYRQQQEQLRRLEQRIDEMEGKK